MKYAGVPFKDALDILELYDYSHTPFEGIKQETGLPDEDVLYLMLVSDGRAKKEEIQKVPPALPPNYKPILDNLNNPEVIPFLTYLAKRGVTGDDIRNHYISYVTYGVHTTPNGSKINLSNHLVFFTFDTSGQYQYWNTRSIDPNTSLKSINAPSKETEYGKADVIFNFNRAKHTDKIVLTEGVFDALTVGDSGVALYGKKMSDNQFNLLKTHLSNQFPIHIFLDSDAKEEINQTMDKLRTYFKKVYLVKNDSDLDPNDLGRERAQELVEKAVEASPEQQLLFNLL